jgi:cephalosporin hydroxylase
MGIFMNDLTWTSEREFKIAGINFCCALHDYALRTNDERIVILKNRTVLEDYISVLGATPPGNVLEFGIFQGGSPVLFSLMFGLSKFVGIDICKRADNVESFLEKHPIGKRIKTYYEVSQADREAVIEIAKNEFREKPIDLIIDDASHEYELSKATFETVFPLLAPGGTYVLEDWGWAHWPGSTSFQAKTSLSILLFQVIMLCASRQDIIREVRVLPSFAFIKKGNNPPSLDGMTLEKLYNIRGMQILPQGTDATAPDGKSAQQADQGSRPAILAKAGQLARSIFRKY